MRIQDFIGQELVWKQPRVFASEYELRAGDQVIGTLNFRSAWGSLATAGMGGNSWTFKRVGFFQTRVTIRSTGAENELAAFRNNTWTGGGTLELPGGLSYRANTNFWHTRFEFIDPEDRPLVRYTTHSFLRQSGEMEILPDALRAPELPWLAMLGWYLAVLMHRDDASAAVVSTG